MASRTMHLAVMKELCAFVDDNGRFMFGAILPDAFVSLPEPNGHFRRDNENGTRVFDLSHFRSLYASHLGDELYLGYYLHLIQDIIFRNFVGVQLDSFKSLGDYVERLHSDYRQLNAYVIEKYGVINCVSIPQGFENEPINKMFSFETREFLDEMKTDFLPIEKKPLNFFTYEMTDEYIGRAAEASRLELEAIKNGGRLFDENKYAWKIKE